ncbi:MAG: DNA translocase FtsK 4TM domain-containing protein [Desulfotignum sp.]|nr:DNA translocase FtsK 4TM domain-containing protein [Desulfotignum sp.]
MRKELTSLLLFFLIILSGISLFSFHAQDPSLGHDFLVVPDTIHNQFGLVGAHVAGFFIFLFGIGAFWVPVIISLVTLWYLKEKSPAIIWMTLAGGMILMICTGAGFFLFKDAYAFSNTLIPAGGMLGSAVTAFLLTYANIAGCIVVLVFFAVIGFILATGISMVTLGVFVHQKVMGLAATITRDVKQFFDYLKDQAVEWKNRRSETAASRDMQNMSRILLETRLPATGQEAHKTDMSEPNQPDTYRSELDFSDETEDDAAIDIDDMFSPAIVAPQVDESEYTSDRVLEDIRQPEAFKLPSIGFLDEKIKIRREIDTDKLQNKARILETKLNDFNVKGEVVEILPGPVITTFEYRPAPGIKLSKITGLSDDLALALSAISIRIVAPIPGRDVVGIEIPNDEREMVNLREMIASKDFIRSDSMLTLGLGKDLMGRPVVTKMDKMPHLLIAGATGTGKSVGLNAMIISLLYKATPDEVKFIMIDPKRIELSVYNDIPHLISPVVTDMKKATNALFWAVKEMERRYELLEENGLRNLAQYNDKIKEINQKQADSAADNTAKQTDAEPFMPETLPYIVVIVDELSDLMMVASKDVEFALTRLAQMARAAGIHIIIATQRPSADVLTGTIKANFPTRISFQVSSKIDGRIIMDQGGAESLLGNGDMLFCPPGTGKLMRIQGAYISEKEIAKITGFLKEQREPEYDENVTRGDEDEEAKEFDESDYDEKYDEAVAVVTQSGQASISYVQRRLRIGYNRAARLIEIMEHEGIIGPQVGTKPREILVKKYGEDRF